MATLCWAAAVADRVAVLVGEQAIMGDLLFPLAGRLTVPFLPRASIVRGLPAPPDLRPGTDAVLLFGRGEDRFRTPVRVSAPFGSRGVALSLTGPPRGTRDRATGRVDVDGREWRLALRSGHRCFPILDASCGGLGMALSRTGEIPLPGRVLVGDLHSPGADPIAVRLAVVRPAAPLPRSRFVRVGARFFGVGMASFPHLAGRVHNAMDLVAELEERSA